MDEIKKLVQDGLQFLSEDNWSSLLGIAEKIQLVDKENFYGYCFKIAGELEYDFIDAGSDVSYILDSEQINYDLKTRLYHAARQKYLHAPKSILMPLNKMYPDENGEDGKKNKSTSYFDLRHAYFEQLSSHINVVNKKYLHQLTIYAKTPKERSILETYILWTGNVHLALSELNRYDQQATTFVKEDAAKTPKKGNPKLFWLFFIVFIIFAGLFATHGVLIALVYTREDTIVTRLCNISALLTSITLFLGSIIISAFNQTFRKNKLYAVALISLSFFIGAVGLATTYSATTHIERVWYLIFGSVVFFFIILDTINNMLLYLPHFVHSKKYSYLGDEKGLLEDDLDIKFEFDWTKHSDETKEK